MDTARKKYSILTEREFVKLHTFAGIGFLVIALVLSVSIVYETTKMFDAIVLRDAIIKAASIPFLIVPICTGIHIWMSVKERRKVIHLFELAMTDDLTGLPNRRAFMESAEDVIAEIDRTETSLGLFLIDLDFFKTINDTYGHEMGDLALKHVAEIIREQAKDDALFARFGGEEFAMLVRFKPGQNLQVRAERLRKRLASTPMRTGVHSILITASIGVSEVREGDTVNAALSRADNAMYAAKHNGRNQLSMAA